MYGIMKDGNVLEFTTMSMDDADNSVSTAFELYDGNGYNPIWMVDSIEKAELAKVSTPLYNADYETPHHNFNANELKECLITIRIEEL